MSVKLAKLFSESVLCNVNDSLEEILPYLFCHINSYNKYGIVY